MNKFLFRILLIALSGAIFYNNSTAQCPIVNDTFYIENDGNPVYISYLRKATNQALRTQYNPGYSNTPYAWVHANPVPGYPVYAIEGNNAYYLNGATPLIAANVPGNLTQLTPGPTTPGTYLEFGQYPNTSTPNPTGITDKLVRLQIPLSYYGWASFDYNYESCYPYTYAVSYCYQCCAEGSYSTYYNYSTYTSQVYVTTYTCTYYGGVCTSYSIGSTVYTYGPYQSFVCTYTDYCCVGYNYYTNYNACAPSNSPARVTCSKTIYLYVRAPLDIIVNKACSKGSYSADEPIKFTITVSSPLYSEEVDSGQVTDLLPAGLELISYSTNGGTYNPVTGVWSLPKIGNGKSFTMTVTAMATETKTYTNTASFKFLMRKDRDSTNNVSSCSFNATAKTVGSIKPPYNCTNPVVGTTPVCTDTAGYVFSVNAVPVPGAIYTWTVPSGFTILSGQGTNSITVKAGLNPGVISATIFIPATDSTSATTCERSFPVRITTVNSDIRIKKN